MRTQHIDTLIQEASAFVGNTWPLYGFVTSNPLSGYEKQPFDRAVSQAGEILGARVYPEAAQYRQAFHSGDIDRSKLKEMLQEQGFIQEPEYYLEILENEPVTTTVNPFHDIDRITTKWLAAFMDEGLAEWSMPGKEKGFFQAWKLLARYDEDLKGGFRSETTASTASEVIANVLNHFDEEDQLKLITTHLAALPGWTGYIKLRAETGSDWQEYYPVTLEDYLAVRFCIAQAIDAPLLPETPHQNTNEVLPQLQSIWLKAWEATWQESTLATLKSNREMAAAAKQDTTLPDAQLVFCIDTRSEPIRRHVEAAGNYETFGYAGFFGIAMDYVNPDDGHARKSCPPIVPSAYKVEEQPATDRQAAFEDYRKKTKVNNFINYFLKRMKNMLPSTFGFVEGSGLAYGFGLMVRTCFPGAWYRRNQNKALTHEGICAPGLHINNEDATSHIPLNDRAGIVKSAFDLLGWTKFAPLVVFSGHGSHTANNPFGSSLDCGACAASPGRHNARMLAKLANDREVREVLFNEHNIVIPESTWFVGAEHTTTTDRIELFDADVPKSHLQILEQLKKDLGIAQQTATAERLQTEGNGVALAETKAGNWAETRPEWGLAKNAGFIIAPRTTTRDINLQGRCFLHSYDWEHDKEGKALEGIMQGPMVVTQWINNHYYFSSVDIDRFGSGSKITHNVTGMFGVVQGNGGDLKTGLPLQSLRATDAEIYHQPLRLSVMIEAPVERVTDILKRNENLRTLLDNQWIYLIVTDPSKELKTYRYTGNLEWEPRVIPVKTATRVRKRAQVPA
ncbi:DUF2309 domain-containing protein [Robertkochia sediminum]|uniref:DUF2309 domain-containing protein n=1 Tax=Robertkochia sediminum TaxID=2785326 RepID=UPI001933D6A9|nr:DUF2309 domain-containing protein [Robertkochia sediminum]MBL7471257.1 DUF2309 domain-containing protein [Robertkochia sediminum]